MSSPKFSAKGVVVAKPPTKCVACQEEIAKVAAGKNVSGCAELIRNGFKSDISSDSSLIYLDGDNRNDSSVMYYKDGAYYVKNKKSSRALIVGREINQETIAKIKHLSGIKYGR